MTNGKGHLKIGHNTKLFISPYTNAKKGTWTLTHRDHVMQKCISNQYIIGSDNGLSLVGAKPISEPMMRYH